MADAEKIPEQFRKAFAWIEAELGGSVVHAERQPRWRPAWFLDLRRGDETLPLYFRGERGEADHGVYSLEHELTVLRVLEAQGIPVPHVYGLCPEPRGIVMERVRGRANLGTCDDEAERCAVLDDYIDILARVHALDVEPFVDEGLRQPTTAEEIGLVDFNVWERGYRQAKQRPEPAIEFLIRWVRAHVPLGRPRASFICCDSGQFLYDSGRVTALIDLELGCLGDPIADLGGLRGRDLSEPLGDLGRAVARYERVTGAPVERSVLDFHTVRFSLVTPLAVARLVAEPPPGFDFVQYLAWYLVWTRSCLEVVARRAGVPLEPPELPADDGAALEADEASFDSYERDTEARIALYHERRAGLGPALDDADLREAAALSGVLAANRKSADAALEHLVELADPARDAELLRYFYRRLLRDEAVLAPVMRELRGARMQEIP